MTDNNLPPTVRVAARGSKKDWHPVTFDLPPETFRKLEVLRGEKTRSTFVHEIVQSHLDKAA